MRRRRTRIVGWASALTAGLVSVPALGQTPIPATGPVPVMNGRPVGPFRRAIQHTCFVLKDRFIGYPDQFAEPPLGSYVYEAIGIMRSKADTHDFMLYRSDFMDGTSDLSPLGAEKLSLMAARLPGWMGPIYVEWTPDRPGLGEGRKVALLATLQQAGLPVVPERVLVGPSPYPGLLGTDAANIYGNLILRDQIAGQNFSVTPTSTSSFGQGAR